MKSIDEILRKLSSKGYDGRLKEIYVDNARIPYNRQRYGQTVDFFRKCYGEKEIEIYSAPGRSEVCGNHTDHQNGHVLATSINLDIIAVVARTEDNIITIMSENMPVERVDLCDIEKKDEEEGTTTALIKGMAKGMKDYGYETGGFEAVLASDVPMGAGMSSSAAYESLIGTIFSGLYNDMKVPPEEIAKIGQFAENDYFGKPCGLMDQMACAVGGLIYIDFFDKENPVIKQVSGDFEKHKYSLCIVDTKGSHADLTDDYAAVPAEMKMVAGVFGKELLTQVSPEEFFANIKKVRELTNDRAVLRAIHFYTEQDRVKEGVEALEKDEFEHFLDVIKRSGDSSCKLLQNIYSPKDVLTQNVMVALGISEYLIGSDGVCRVHGGGFAGTIQAFVKNEAVSDYKKKIESIFGDYSCHVLKVRPFGGIKVLE